MIVMVYCQKCDFGHRKKNFLELSSLKISQYIKLIFKEYFQRPPSKKHRGKKSKDLGSNYYKMYHLLFLFIFPESHLS